jgi:mannose-6-phosphate isomerase-like protein (cupin superfamily)
MRASERTDNPAEPYLTLDGSLVWELIRPERQGSRHLSVAVAEVAPGAATKPHLHRTSEEVYCVLSGEGALIVAGETARLQPGQAALIGPGQAHSVRCLSAAPLRLLCCCAPPYQHEDTVLIRGTDA